MASDRPILVRCAKVVSVYLLVLGMVIWFWASDSGQWAGGFVPLHFRLMVGLWQATGPFSFGLTRISHPELTLAISLIFLATWSLWLSIVLASPLRNWPLIVHFIMAMSWCAVGFMPTSMLIT